MLIDVHKYVGMGLGIRCSAMMAIPMMGMAVVVHVGYRMGIAVIVAMGLMYVCIQLGILSIRCP